MESLVITSFLPSSTVCYVLCMLHLSMHSTRTQHIINPGIEVHPQSHTTRFKSPVPLQYHLNCINNGIYLKKYM